MGSVEMANLQAKPAAAAATAAAARTAAATHGRKRRKIGQEAVR